MERIDYQRRLGERLRAIRNQQGLTLQQVEERSGGHWKAVVVGAYERGDRAISAAKLADLASFYGVPIGELLPEPARPEVVDDTAGGDVKVIVDLTRLEEEVTPDLAPVSRYVSNIQLQRGDYNGRVLTLRGDDVRALAVVLGISVDELVERLREKAVLAAN
ncbi:MAG TPA: transcriptional regulator [Nitriliruptorales bacterium]|nr:transcriptional regulator [Nitriliruptorales bacterium]